MKTKLRRILKNFMEGIEITADIARQLTIIITGYLSLPLVLLSIKQIWNNDILGAAITTLTNYLFIKINIKMQGGN